MTKLRKWQGTVFTKDNLPELLEYLADYLREYPKCGNGFGLESTSEFHDWTESNQRLKYIFDTLHGASSVKYRPSPLTKTMYNIHTGKPVSVPITTDISVTVIGPSHERVYEDMTYNPNLT